VQRRRHQAVAFALQTVAHVDQQGALCQGQRRRLRRYPLEPQPRPPQELFDPAIARAGVGPGAAA